MNYFNNKEKKIVGIVSFGAAIPLARIKTSEISSAWSKVLDDGLALGISEKTVPAIDQDTITFAIESTNIALAKIDNKNLNIGSVYTGSESHPYAVKSTSAIVGDAIGIDNNYTAADLEFACKAGTAAVQVVCSEVLSGMVEYGIAIGADTAQSKPGDPLEYSASAAGASFIIGSNKDEIVAKLIATTSYTSDTPDFWRREHMVYPSHGGRFTGEPAYFKHIKMAVDNILKISGSKISDFDHVVFHMPNGRFPKTIAKSLGVTDEQLALGFLVPYLGNSYSACSLVGLVNVLENSNKGEKILLCSYGSGSGSDAFIFEITNNIDRLKRVGILKEQIENKKYISYLEYRKSLNKL
jgi:hydroxymethylglutaryl-CoA synthase